MAEPGSGGCAEEQLLMQRDTLASMTMSELRNGIEIERGDAGNGNVICFGSIPVVLDVAGSDSRGDAGIEIHNLRQEEAMSEKCGGEEEEGDQQVTNAESARSERLLEEGGQQVTNAESARSERLLEEGDHTTELNRMEGEDVADCTRRKQRIQELADKDRMVESLSLFAAGIDRSLGLGDAGVEPAAEVAPEARFVLERGFDGSQNGDNELRDNEMRNGIETLPLQLPPVLSSVDERSITLSWMGDPMWDECAFLLSSWYTHTIVVSYELDFACNEASTASKRGPSFVSDLQWTSVSCGEGLSYKVDNLKSGTPYSFRIRAVPSLRMLANPPRVTYPLAVPLPPAVSDTAEFSTLPAAPCQPSPTKLVDTALSHLEYSLMHNKRVVPDSIRKRAVPSPVPPLVAPLSTAVSDIAEFSTVPAAPSQPSSPKLVTRRATPAPPVIVGKASASTISLSFDSLLGPPYSFRVRAVPSHRMRAVPSLVTYPLVMPVSPAVSDIAEFSILSAAPSHPSPTILVNRARSSLKYSLITNKRATNSVGRSQFCKEACYTTEASVPVAPEAPTLVFASATSMSVEWQEPNNCGSPITDYTLEYDDGEGGSFTSVNTRGTRRYTMHGLRSGHVYQVRVLAHNQEGKGSFSRPAELLTNFAAPSHLLPPSMSGRTTTSIAVTWGPPECDGGSPITAFELEMKTLTTSWTLIYYGITNTYTVTGLSPGIHVDVRVRAVNLMGKSGWSGEGRFSTLPGPPEAPSAPEALTVGSSRIVLGWCPPAHDGGSRVISCSLEMNDVRQNVLCDDVPKTANAEGERRFVTVYSGYTCKSEVEGLEPGASYYFKVRATNKQGAGPYSEIITVKTLCARPATPAPPVIVGKASASSISLRWYSPQSNGGSIQSYLLQMLVIGYGEKRLPGGNENILTTGDDPRSESFEGLAGQRDSYSPFSGGLQHSPSHSTSSDSKSRPCSGTSEDEHDVHGVLSKRGVDGSVALAHSLDSGLIVNGGDRSMGWRNVYSGSSTGFTVSKLQAFTSHAFRLRAQNGAGCSEFSALSTIMTSSAAPCAPCPPTVVETSSSSATLRWEVPEQDNGSPVCGFTLEMLKVKASRESPSGQRTSSTTSAKYRMVHRDPSYRTEEIVWEAIFDGDGVRRYEASDLLPGQKYTFRVIAHNALGTSPPSSVVEVTTLSAAPEAPLAPTFSKVMATSVLIKWSPPARDNGKSVTGYRLMMDDGRGPVKVWRVRGTSDQVFKLQSGSSYRVAVQAFNYHGASAFSEEAVVELPVAPPPAPPSTKVDLSVEEERQSPIMPVNKAKPSLWEELTEIVNFVKEMNRKVQEPWCLKTRRWIAAVGVSVTLFAMFVNHMYN